MFGFLASRVVPFTLCGCMVLAGCSSGANLGVTLPIGPHIGVGVSVGTDGSLGVGVGVSGGGGQIGVGTSGQLPVKKDEETPEQK